MNIKRLPDTEFELMRIIWRSEPPVTTNEIMEQLKSDISWKPQTVLTMLVRLIEKGFLESARIGRQRNYTPIINERDYMSVETGEFISRYRGNSIGSLVKTMYDGKNMTDEDLKELKKWLKERE
ncbi:MAG: BlaI/MecI/CopY family transcriptional regulator [Defluviitaleaceae bacterium]|nr:BlaI/MecI/CopY family transcriptional regulator [Defluviitaleaceae bacterium]